MGHSRNKLTTKSIKALPEGSYGDGGGLWLRKTSAEQGQWVYRFRFHGRARQMGLGSLSKVSLAKAREFRDVYQHMVVDGLDPVSERRKERSASKEGLLTLESVSADAFDSRRAEVKDDGKAGRWFSPIKLHILPKLGRRPIIQID